MHSAFLDCSFRTYLTYFVFHLWLVLAADFNQLLQLLIQTSSSDFFIHHRACQPLASSASCQLEQQSVGSGQLHYLALCLRQLAAYQNRPCALPSDRPSSASDQIGFFLSDTFLAAAFGLRNSSSARLAQLACSQRATPARARARLAPALRSCAARAPCAAARLAALSASQPKRQPALPNQPAKIYLPFQRSLPYLQLSASLPQPSA